MKTIDAFLVISYFYLFVLAPQVVLSDNSFKDWSCSPVSTKKTSQDYRQKVLDVLEAVEVNVMTYASWDLLYRTTGQSSTKVVGSGGCTLSKEMKKTNDCYACIHSVKQHLVRLCPNSIGGSVSLHHCSLMFGQVESERDDVDEFEWVQWILEDKQVEENRAVVR